MNKEDFLSKLRKKLSVLEESEIDDIISEYSGYIEEKVGTGATEEEAVKELGNVNEIAEDLLSAYKVKSPKEDNDVVEKVINKFSDFIDLFISKFEGKSTKDIIHFVIELAFIFLVILLCKIPFIFIEGIFSNMFNLNTDNFALLFINNFWHFIIEVTYIIFAVILFIKIFKRKYGTSEYIVERKPNVSAEKKADKTEVVKTSKKNIDTVEKKEHKTISDIIYIACISIIKFFIVWILFGIACYLIGIACGATFYVYLLIKGVKYIGIGVILIGLMSIGVAFFEMFFKLLVERKNKWTKILLTVVVSLLMLGVGGSITALEFADTTFIPASYKDNKIIKTENITMQDNLVISGVDADDYVIDESIDGIKVVFKYNNKYSKIAPIVEYDDNIIRFGYEYTSFNLKNFMKVEIEGLKKKELYELEDNPQIEIHTNKANRDKLIYNNRVYHYGNNSDIMDDYD